ncbi:ATP-dependent translocase ABCB1-like [Trichomycterus rosablanca]|uniref:ATP-dependent translocase ABCB1-like n=1 Tax=Trichomycterus rosablanca TaxID=2290929 RepID=UPI002F35E7D4
MNLKVPSGKMIALVGASGCGKSTTIQLLQRFYDPDSGEVTLDGRDIRTLNVRWLRENVGIVSQEPVLFGTTIAENIRYGREDATDEDIERAIREANAYEFISRLPDKLNTMVGERGAQLSGGQKQRIAIARALVKNPKILLLDEATSALDTQSESIVQAALDKARAGRTTIVIAHRLSTIRTADVIAGFKDGQVEEQGTHKELMNRKGVYYSLIMQQSAGRPDTDTYENEDDEDDSDPEGEEFDWSSDEPKDLVEVTIENGGLERNSIRRSTTLHRTTSNRTSKKKKRKFRSKKEKKEREEVQDVPFFTILSLNKPEWPYLVIGIVASIIGAAVYPCVAILFSKIIGVFAEVDLDVKRQKTLMFSLLFLLVGAVALVTIFFQGYMFGKSGEILTMRLRSQAFQSILRQDIAWFDDHNNAVGVLTTKLATDASLVKGVTGSRLGLAANTIFCLGIAIIVAFAYCWQLTLLILACVPFLTGAHFVQMRTMGGHASKDQSALEMSGKISTETVENFRTVVALTKEPVFFRMFTEALSKPYRSALCKAPIYGLTFAFSQSIPFFVNSAIFRFGAWLIAHCYTEYENVFLVFSVIFFAAISIGQSSSFAPDFAKAKVAAWRILKLLEKKPEIDIYSEEGDKPGSFAGDVEFRDVHFNYPTRPNVKILQGLNVSVAQGQTLALVGESGCGKSTSVQLLERFYNPASGQVFVDGVDTKQLNLAWLRAQMGLVSQEPILFDCTIAENIQYGDNSRVVGQEEIEQAARNANIHDFIVGLPEKYNTRVGDKGTQLSGGQKQRIAIARALVRQPKVLLLDEATSALDTESEKVVQKALDDARQGRTCIVIAHRLTTVQNADIIAVIKNGQVAEQGTHSQLMATQGAYYALLNIRSVRENLMNGSLCFEDFISEIRFPRQHCSRSRCI